MEQPLVSVCIPAYNNSKYIERTINAVLNQTYKNLEVVVVDDCSKDDTAAKVEAIMQNDNRVRLIKNEKNLGMTGNWNKVIREGRGEYIKLLPADDLVYRECIEKSMNSLLKSTDITLCITDTDLIDDDDKKVGKYAHWPKAGIQDGKKMIKKSVLFNNFFGNPVCAMFRKSDFEKTGGFDPDIPYILDFDLWIGLASLGEVYMIKESLNGFRVRNDSNTGQLIGNGRKAYNDEHKRLLDKHIKLGHVKLNSFEYWFSNFWRKTRNWLIAIYIKVIHANLIKNNLHLK